MRCKCCNSTKDVRLYLSDWYCKLCRRAIRKTMDEDYDDHFGKLTGYKWSDEVDLIHTAWDDEDG